MICRSDVQVADHSLPCVAVDAGLFYCLSYDLSIVTAIGDFDSLSPAVLSDYTGEVIKIAAEKDQSDLALALDYLKECKEPIYVYGALGGRMDHCLVNLKLCYYSDLDLRLLDEQNLIYCLRPGIHRLNEKTSDYVSFSGFEDCHITLQGFKYPLDNYLLKLSDNLTLSNELVDDTASVEVDARILIMFSKDKQPGGQNEDPAL